MKRITPEMIQEAQTKTGLKPVQSMTATDTCACGLGMLAIAAGQTVNTALAWAQREFGMDYAGGFVCGWDGVRWRTTGYPQHVVDESQVTPGVEDGRKCWESVKHLAVAA